jgi:chemotaxis protein methyltransferase CheR
MSVATVQQQLQPSGLGDRIEVGPYLSKLCDSLRNSMINHSSPHSLLVQAAAGTVESSQAVSLGLVTTELVINALKHAFPPGHEGEIVVRYDVDGAGWRLSVSDNGVGRRDDGHERAGGGLGTSIVEVLSQRLNARTEMSAGPQGTIVSIIHVA